MDMFPPSLPLVGYSSSTRLGDMLNVTYDSLHKAHTPLYFRRDPLGAVKGGKLPWWRRQGELDAYLRAPGMPPVARCGCGGMEFRAEYVR